MGLVAAHLLPTMQDWERKRASASATSGKRFVRSSPGRLYTRALQHYLGHKNIQHTVRYTELSPDRFRDFWRD